MRSTMDLVEAARDSIPVNVERLVEQLTGARPMKCDLQDNISGYIERVDGSYRIAVNKNHHYYRQRFTMGHEIGHFVLHRAHIEGRHQDNRMFRAHPDSDDGVSTQQHEYEANAFSGWLLLPDQQFAEAYSELNGDEKALMRRFLMSRQPIQIRARQLGLL